MKKIIVTAIVAFSIGSLSILTKYDCKECKPSSTQSVTATLADHNFLATAD